MIDQLHPESLLNLKVNQATLELGTDMIHSRFRLGSKFSAIPNRSMFFSVSHSIRTFPFEHALGHTHNNKRQCFEISTEPIFSLFSKQWGCGPTDHTDIT